MRIFGAQLKTAIEASAPPAVKNRTPKPSRSEKASECRSLALRSGGRSRGAAQISKDASKRSSSVNMVSTLKCGAKQAH